MTVSLYRKYRPQTFDEVVGQSIIEQTLKNALANDNVSHAYLFCGPRGVGKTTTARLLAKALFCEKGPTPDPCGVCEQCTDIAAGVHPDVYELDAASRTGVENVREEIISRVAFSPTRGRYKVYIIDEVHMLSIPAFNALLKTLEEPPDHIVFILCTTDPHKVPETIQSRCQRFDFHRIADTDIVANLHMICDNEAIKADDEVLELIARHSQGGMRDAITTLEQLSVFTNGDIHVKDADGLFGEVKDNQIHDVVDLIARRDIAGCFRWVASFVEAGTDIAQFARDLTACFRDLYVINVTDSADGLIDSSPDEIAARRQLAATFSGPDRIARILLILSDLSAELRTSTDQRLSLEIAFTRMAHPTSDLTLEALAERIELLEQGAPIAAQPQPAPQPRPVAQTPSAETRQAAAPAPQRPATSVAAPRPTATPVSTPAPAARETPTPVPVTTPAPAEPPIAKTADGTTELDQSTISRRWAVAAKEIQGQRKSLAGLIAIVRPHLDSNGGMILELPQGSEFSKRMMETVENQKLIKEAICSAFGEAVPYAITVSNEKLDIPAPFEAADTVEMFGGAVEETGADLVDADDDEFVYDDDADSAPEGTPLSFDDPSVAGMFDDEGSLDGDDADDDMGPVDIGGLDEASGAKVMSFGDDMDEESDDDGTDGSDTSDLEDAGGDDDDGQEDGFAPIDEMDEDLAKMIFGTFSSSDSNGQKPTDE